MRFDWRQMIGPALTAVSAATALAVDAVALPFATATPLLVLCTGLSAAIGGAVSGIVSAAIVVATAAIALPDHPTRLIDIAALAASVVALAAMTGHLRSRMMDAMSWHRRRHATAERLSAALDRIDIGVVLLDPDTRAEFINRAFRTYFSLPDAKAATRPPFVALMYHGRDAGVYTMPDDEMAHYIAERTERMRSGDPTPLHLTLSDGRVLRVSCAALPDGSRMMSYAPINDTLRHGDDPAQRARYLAMRNIVRPGRKPSLARE